MTEEEFRVCGYQADKSSPPCDGVGIVQRSGEKAKMGIRYLKCQKCGATWQVSFKPAEGIDRTPAEPPSLNTHSS